MAEGTKIRGADIYFTGHMVGGAITNGTLSFTKLAKIGGAICSTPRAHSSAAPGM